MTAVVDGLHLYRVTFYHTEGTAGNALRVYVQSNAATDALVQAATRARIQGFELAEFGVS